MNEGNGFTIKIVPDKSDTIRTIHLSKKMLWRVVLSFFFSIFFILAVFSYVFSVAVSLENDDGDIAELRRVGQIQQEQLLQLSKKIDDLQQELDALEQMESELRRMTGIAAPAAVDSEATKALPIGQGGSLADERVKELAQTLRELEKRVVIRRESIKSLRQDFQMLQEEFAAFLPYNYTYAWTGAAVTIPSIWPTEGEISSPFGWRWNGTDFHSGIDIANDFGTPIVASADGIVTDAAYNGGGYGNKVDIDHGNGIMTRYAHAQAIVVRTGQEVRCGQVIAYMGSTGFSTGPHLHYEVRINGEAVNPIFYLARAKKSSPVGAD